MEDMNETTFQALSPEVQAALIEAAATQDIGTTIIGVVLMAFFAFAIFSS